MVNRDIEILTSAIDRLEDRMTLELESVQVRLDLLADSLGIETRWFDIDKSSILRGDGDDDLLKKHLNLTPKEK